MLIDKRNSTNGTITVSTTSGHKKAVINFDFYSIQITIDRDRNRFYRIVFCAYGKRVPKGPKGKTNGKTNITAVYYLDNENSSFSNYKNLIKYKRAEFINKTFGTYEKAVIEKNNCRVLVSEMDFVKNIQNGI